MQNTELIKDRTNELVIYVANKLKEEPKYGAVLLNKALYFIDCISYLKNSKPISDLSYVKQEMGPTPKPSQFLAIKNMLLFNGEAEEKKIDYFGFIQKRFIPTREANLDLFEKKEISLIDEVIKSVSIHSATSISDFTHTMLAWKSAEQMEELPHFTVLLTSVAPSENDIKWAKEKAKKYVS